MANDRSEGPSGEFWAGAVVALFVVWFVAYNFFGFRIQGVFTGDFFPEGDTPSASGTEAAVPTAPVDPTQPDGDAIVGARDDAINALETACLEDGGSPWSCGCVAEFLVDNTSQSEMAFGDEPPSVGQWIYFGGRMWVPRKYQSDFEACGA